MAWCGVVCEHRTNQAHAQIFRFLQIAKRSIELDELDFVIFPFQIQTASICLWLKRAQPAVDVIAMSGAGVCERARNCLGSIRQN